MCPTCNRKFIDSLTCIKHVPNCPSYIVVCQICKSPELLSNLEKHHLEVHHVRCSPDCRKHSGCTTCDSQVSTFLSTKEKCPMSIFGCQEFFVGDHGEICEFYSVKCFICREFFPRKNLSEHFEISHPSETKGIFVNLGIKSTTSNKIPISQTFSPEINDISVVFSRIMPYLDISSLIAVSLVHKNSNILIKKSDKIRYYQFRQLNNKPECPTCRKPIFFQTTWEEHVQNCKAYEIKCKICSQAVPRSTWREHVEGHKDTLINMLNARVWHYPEIGEKIKSLKKIIPV